MLDVLSLSSSICMLHRLLEPLDWKVQFSSPDIFLRSGNFSHKKQWHNITSDLLQKLVCYTGVFDKTSVNKKSNQIHSLFYSNLIYK